LGFPNSSHLVNISTHGGEVSRDRHITFPCCNQLVAKM
jgi:hypothetical protein